MYGMYAWIAQPIALIVWHSMFDVGNFGGGGRGVYEDGQQGRHY